MEARLAHAAGHSSRVAIDAGHEGMSELLVGGSVVERLHDDGLAAGVPSAEDEHDLTHFHNLAHDGLQSKNNEKFNVRKNLQQKNSAQDQRLPEGIGQVSTR